VSAGPDLDGILVQWGDRLFYPGNRIVPTAPTPRLSGSVAQRAAAIRRHIRATVVRRAPQVMVTVTGGGRGMAAIAAHFRYITKAGRLRFEDNRGLISEGKDELREMAWQWQYGGSYIGETSHRREAFNIMLSMPHGTDPVLLQRAARQFAQTEFADHTWVMVLHDHQANPHVHLSVRAESKQGRRLNPRKADLHRWRETFSEKLRGLGVDAEATRQATRGALRWQEPLWRIKAADAGRLRSPRDQARSTPASERTRKEAAFAWAHIAHMLARSEDHEDRALAQGIDRYVRELPLAPDYARLCEKLTFGRDRARVATEMDRAPELRR
jgi:hypothetical protein